jgi:uncharacterized membrane protein
MKHLLIVFILAAFCSACGTSANDEKPSVKYEEKKKSLEETERDNPLQFLKMTNGNNHSNLVNKVVIEGQISNIATLVSYKDIEVKITIKDAQGSVIEKDTKTLDMTIRPGNTQTVKIKVKRPKGTNSVIYDIIGATAVK